MAYRTHLRLYRVGADVLIECDRCGPVGVQTGDDRDADQAASQHLVSHGTEVTD